MALPLIRLCGTRNFAENNTVGGCATNKDTLCCFLERLSNFRLTWFKDNFMQANCSNLQMTTFGLQSTRTNCNTRKG